MPKLHTLRAEVEHKVNQLTTQQLDLDDHLEKFMSKIEELKANEASSMNKLSLAEENYTKDKVVFDQIATERAADWTVEQWNRS